MTVYMKEIKNKADAASKVIDEKIKYLSDVETKLLEKRDENEYGNRSILFLVYIIGIIVGVILTMFCSQFGFLPVEEEISKMIVFFSGISNTIFFCILFYRNYIEMKYEKNIINNLRKIYQYKERLEKYKKSCMEFYGLLSGNNARIDCIVEIGDDCDEIIEGINKEISKIEKKDMNATGGLLQMVYFISAITSTLLLMLIMLNTGVIEPIFNLAEGRDGHIWALVGSVVGGIVGPILSWYYCVEIRKNSDARVFHMFWIGLLCGLVVIIASAIVSYMFLMPIRSIIFVFIIGAIVDRLKK